MLSTYGMYWNTHTHKRTYIRHVHLKILKATAHIKCMILRKNNRHTTPVAEKPLLRRFKIYHPSVNGHGNIDPHVDHFPQETIGFSTSILVYPRACLFRSLHTSVPW